MGRVSFGTTQMDIKGGDNARTLRQREEEEKRKGQEEEVKYTGALNLENSCIPNVFGKQPCWSIDEHLRYYIRKEKMKSARVTDISIACVGDEYIEYLEKWVDKMPDWKFWILTDKPEKVKKILQGKRHVVVPYNKPRFNYFDKLLWALDTIIETGRPVLQIDAKRLTYRLHIVEKFLDKISMVNALYHKPVYENSAYFLGVWSPGMKANQVPTVTNHDLRYGLNYWKPILAELGNDTDKWAPIVEHTMLLNLTKEKAKQVWKDIKEKEPMFRKQSMTQINPYKGAASGEGLALGYAFYKNNVNTRPLLLVQQLAMHNPADFTHPWDNTEYREKPAPCSFTCMICNNYKF